MPRTYNEVMAANGTQRPAPIIVSVPRSRALAAVLERAGALGGLSAAADDRSGAPSQVTLDARLASHAARQIDAHPVPEDSELAQLLASVRGQLG